MHQNEIPFGALVESGMQILARSEFLFTEGPFVSCHASTLVERSDGSLLAAWFAGSAEGAPDVGIWSSVRTGKGWTPPRKLVQEPNIACYNPVLFYTSNQCLWLYYRFGPGPSNWTAGRLWSRDEGQTWSRVEHLPAGLYGPIRTKPLILADGTILSGTSVESYRSWACWIERSTDQGKSWSKIGPITLPSKFIASTPAPLDAPQAVPGWQDWKHTPGIIQPAPVALEGSHLRLYARSTALTARICVADSLDGGLIWSSARPIHLPNPNSGIDAVSLKDGRILLAYNHSAQARTPLNLALSQDGERFQRFLTLEDAPGEYSYPAMIAGRDGEVHITYTWNRERIRYLRIPFSHLP